MKVKPNNPLELRKVSASQYLTTDNLYLIAKDEKGWFWQVTDGVQWTTNDKRRYRTREWVARCVEADRYQLNDELQLWEG